MWHYFDVALMSIIVVVCAAYAVYALGSVKLKRAVLTLLVKVFGVRVFAVFSPRLGGCSACSGGESRAELVKKLTTQK